MPDQDFVYKGADAKGKASKPIPYKDLDLNLRWDSFAPVTRTHNQGHSEICG
jgi:hypothetical protein